MSVRAYYTSVQYPDGHIIYDTDLDFCVFNTWSDFKVFSALLDYANDSTNSDGVGFFEIEIDDLLEFIVEEEEILSKEIIDNLNKAIDRTINDGNDYVLFNAL